MALKPLMVIFFLSMVKVPFIVALVEFPDAKIVNEYEPARVVTLVAKLKTETLVPLEPPFQLVTGLGEKVAVTPVGKEVLIDKVAFGRELFRVTVTV